MDSKETRKQQEQQNQKQNLQPPHGTLTGSYYDHNAAALMGPTSTSQAMHQQQQHPQPQQALGLDGSPSSAATQQPSMQLGNEKRGPRKYDFLSLSLRPPGGANAKSSDSPPAKRSRGRPPLNNKPKALVNAGLRSLTPHIIHVNAGKDIAAKIVEFTTQQGPLEVCILSAVGTVSSPMLLHSNDPNNPIGVVEYEGEYEIIGMSVSFLNTDESNLSVSLANHNHNGNIFSGLVAGRLVAGSQVLIVVGSFAPERVNQSAGSVETIPEPASASAPATVLGLSGGGPGSPQSQGLPRLSESSEENDLQVGNSTPQKPHNPQ